MGPGAGVWTPVSLLDNTVRTCRNNSFTLLMPEEAHIQGLGVTYPPPVSLLDVEDTTVHVRHFLLQPWAYTGGRGTSLPSPVSLLVDECAPFPTTRF